MSVYDHPLADLDPTEAEIAVLNEVLGELGGYPPGYEPPDDDDPGDGPWHDSPALAYEYGEDADLAEIGGMIDLAHYSEQQRLEEDAEPLPRKAEDRMAHLIDRASRGTYTEHPAFRAAADLANGEPIHGCGPLDEFGRCGSRFHSAYCFETVRTSAATGNHEAASQWRDALLSNTRTAIELASRTGPDFDDLLEDPGPHDQATYQRMRELMGISGRTGQPRPMRPAVQITPHEMGIF